MISITGEGCGYQPGQQVVDDAVVKARALVCPVNPHRRIEIRKSISPQGLCDATRLSGLCRRIAFR
jgi:hypothetical protein